MIHPTAEAGARGDDAPRPFSIVDRLPAFALAAVVAFALAGAAFVLHGDGEGARLSLSVVFGALFGFVLQRSRFCFFCMFRDWLDRRDPRGLVGLLVALATGMAGYAVVFGAWLPDPASGRLPPDAFIGPVSVVLVLAGLSFGAGMAISGSCVSAHLYRLGEGSPTAPFALVGTAVGLVLGLLAWNAIHASFVASAPVVWLPALFGYAGALVLGLAGLAALGLVLARYRDASLPDHPKAYRIWDAVFVERWPAWIGGGAVGALATAAFLRVGPLGVTAEIGARSRQLANGFGLLPSHIEGLDTLRGCVAAAGDALLTPNGLFVGALVLASFASALLAGRFRPARPRLGQILRGLCGGVLLGFGAMIGLGCTVGTLLSGIMAGALSGWIFGAAVFAGIAATLRAERLLAHAAIGPAAS